MINYKIENNILLINNKKVYFSHDIKTVIELEGLLIVEIRNKSSNKVSEQPLNNVYAVNQAGDIEWNIKDIIGDDRDRLIVGIRREGDNLFVVDFTGIRRTIDVLTRKILFSGGYK